jgi:glutamate dehydrogenase
MAKTLTINTANIIASTLKFPEYTEAIDIMAANIDGIPTPRSPINKLVDQVVRAPSREPSPQPTHFSVPAKNGNGNGHRVLRSATVGYIAPEFKGKKAQMLQGW